MNESCYRCGKTTIDGTVGWESFLSFDGGSYSLCRECAGVVKRDPKENAAVLRKFNIERGLKSGNPTWQMYAAHPDVFLDEYGRVKPHDITQDNIELRKRLADIEVTLHKLLRCVELTAEWLMESKPK